MSIVVDTTGFEKLCRDFGGRAKVPYPKAVRIQTAKTMEATIKYTPYVKPKDAKDRAARKVLAKFNTFADGAAGTKDTVIAGVPFTGSAGRQPRISISQKKGRVWVREGGKFHIMAGGTPRRWSDARWAAYQAQEAQRRSAMQSAADRIIPRVAASVGLARRSWWDACEELGLASLMTVPAYVKKARPSNHRSYTNGFGTDESSAFKTLLVIRNDSPLLEKKGAGINALRNALNSRQTAFEKEITTGVFDDFKSLAQRYPGVVVTR